MNTRSFGRLGWQVSEIGYGMWGMAGWTGSEDAESLASLQRAIELGCNFFDTAWAYGEGHSERLLGEIFSRNRDVPLYAATKIPPKNRQWPARPEFSLDDCYPPGHINEFVDRSLSSTGLPALDLIQLHTWNDGWLDDDRCRQRQRDQARRLAGARLGELAGDAGAGADDDRGSVRHLQRHERADRQGCLLYTSDAADE